MTPPREKLRFSQAARLEPLPAPLRLGEIPESARNALFGVLVRQFEKAQKTTYQSSPWRRPNSPAEYRERFDGGFWGEVLWRKHIHFDHKPADEFVPDVVFTTSAFKHICMDEPYNKLLDVLEFIARQENAAHRFVTNEFNAVFEMYRIPYRLDGPGPNVIALTTETEGEVVKQAFAALGADEFSGARKHLRDAGVYLGQRGKEADSVRESIHAVEAVCRVLANHPKATLDDALKVLASKVDLHGGFKKALGNLYGYASDKEGIRHSLLEDGSANVDLADAQFMYGACAGFVTFLMAKARSAGLI